MVGRGTWVCIQCEAGTYIVDPNNAAHSCEQCPAGAVCSGGALVGKTAGSVWEPDVSGRYQLAGCPPAYSVSRDSYADQALFNPNP